LSEVLHRALMAARLGKRHRGFAGASFGSALTALNSFLSERAFNECQRF
jgi:hypothetical protein